jgi:hypothetical protein
MNAKTRKPAQPRFDLFKVDNGSQVLVCRDLNTNQALALLPQLQGLFILKFAGFGKETQ